MAQSKVKHFEKEVWAFYKKNRRALPWRTPALKVRKDGSVDPYKILVSEIMLQQTQVDRVIPYYKHFLKRFPNVQALARAPLGDVLRLWSGLGYNRRAKMLHNAAKKIVAGYKIFPKGYAELRALPGVGEYTAKAVRVFAFNEPETLFETNVRTVYIHHFFPKKTSVSDTVIAPLLNESIFSVQCPNIAQNGGAREWYTALMDYGSYIKKKHGNIARKSKNYVKQKPLKGSNREIRGILLKTLKDKPQTLLALYKLPFEKERIKKQLGALNKEEIIVKKGALYTLP